ncbi:hypothetical protein [Streptomyces roseicoloratus]|uniref:ABM domain-containing protein n=1 Tax=Streptomyces roseicoloratus TaxID=2508722 RepID=A0ABY9RQW8_9ACTN|nr:hypothetical protein [Streptomyces roseicoloratus]WMX44589.1 hypothetical protein RGF97_06555 [Streptomyces roseicoloratus]
MYPREREPELTVIGRFATTAPPGAFEPELLAYARRRASRKGHVSRVTAALAGRPGHYVHLDRWTGLDRLLRAAHEAPAVPPAPAETELAVTVGMMAPNGTPAEAARLVLLRAAVDHAADPERFELGFGSLVGLCVAESAFGGSLLLRSATDPYAYTGLLWWHDPTADDRVRTSTSWDAARARLAATARLTEDLARPLPTR